MATLVLSGCSGSDRPDVEEVADALADGPLPAETRGSADFRECVAQRLVDSDMSDEWLAVFVGLSDEPYQPTGEDSRVMQDAFVGAQQECMLEVPPDSQ